MDNIAQFGSYINYYKGVANPGYAVLITGEWGAGKTYQIKRILSEREIYYVSLFDITSVEAIYAAVFYKMSPIKAAAKDAAKGVGETSIGTDALTFGLGGIVGKLANAVIKESIKNDRVIVLDDIERCSVDINLILGVINKYIEHHGCRVIVIAHDEKIKNSFDNTKEKVFGQTLKVEPNIHEAFNHFMAEEVGKAMPVSIKSVVLNTFIVSGCASMRILKHSARDAQRLFENIDDRYIGNDRAMSEVFAFFTAMSISYRYGTLKDADLYDRVGTAVNYYVNKDEVEIPEVVRLSELYKQKGMVIDFSSSILSDENLVNCLSKGYYDKNLINRDISFNRHFEQTHEELWRKLMNFDDLPKSEVDGTILLINEQLRSFSITDSGKLLHIFNMKLLMSLIGAHSLSYNDVEIEFRNYMQSLLKKDLFELNDASREFSVARDSSHGYGYWIKDDYRKYSNKMFGVVDHFNKCARRKKYPSYIEEIIRTMNESPQEFVNLISSGYSGQGKYAYIDVLNYIKPYRFVEVWLGSPVSHWGTIREGLEARYSTGALHSQLHSESLWIRQVNFILFNRASKLTGFDRLRIERLRCRTN